MERFEAEENGPELDHNSYENNPNVARFPLQYLGINLQIILYTILYKYIYILY